MARPTKTPEGVKINNVRHLILRCEPDTPYKLRRGWYERFEANTSTMRGFVHFYDETKQYRGHIPASFRWEDVTKKKRAWNVQ